MEEYEAINTLDDYPKGKGAGRSLVRMVVFQILYQDDMNPGSRKRFADSFLSKELPDHEALLRFARTLLDGTETRKTEIDAALADVAQNWSLARMNATDRSILRLAAFEILYTDTPRPVVINEAVELAKKFGTNDSAAFVNGVLDKIQSAS